MNTTEQKNIITLAIGLIAFLNTAAISFGWYHLDNVSLRNVDQYVSFVVTGIGVIISHRKSIKSYFIKGAK